MHAVFLCEALFAPGVHGFQSAHDGKLVPNGATGKVGKPVHYLLHDRAGLVHMVASPSGTLPCVVVGDEDKGAVGAGLADSIHQFQIVVLECHRVEAVAESIVHPDTEDDQVGAEQLHIASEICAAQV